MVMRKSSEEAALFHAFLRQNGLKKTYQKDLILETFIHTEGHLSVDDIYALVKRRDRRVGVVTVFRTMKSLTACGIAKEIVLGDGVTRFEHSYRHPAHHHIVCMECHKTIEYACPALDTIQEEVVRKYHFQPLHNRFQTYGICGDCLEHRPVPDTAGQDTERVFERDALKMIVCMTGQILGFYRSAAQRNQDPEGRDIFENMARAEEKRIEGLNRKLEEISTAEKLIEFVPVFLHFDPRELESLIPDLSSHGKAGEFRLGAEETMALIGDLNRKTREFFEAYAAKFPETEGKKILLDFAARESRHAERLQRDENEAQAPSAGSSSQI